ncbi:MAG: hypothetical protein A2Y93_06705 [Chloroflexi bacterium RBG_13_68_17]|nr:MAG: hypothetical protein A2Y93_06705 [Chloroflexi bacterium RBG_13_68_17]
MRRRGRLRNRIIAWSLIPTSLILLAVALVILRSYQQVTEDLVLGRNRELTRLAAGQLGSELTAYSDLLEALAEEPGIRQGDPAAQADSLEQAQNRLVVFDAGVVILNNQGVVAAGIADTAELMGEDWSDRAFFHQMLRTMGPTFSDVFSIGPQEQGVFAVAVPLINDQGGFGGSAVGMFRLGAPTFSAFYGGIVKLRIAEGNNSLLADSNGRLIYHPDPAQIGGELAETWIIDRIAQGQVDALRMRNGQGSDVLASFSPVPGTPWGLVTEESWAAVTASSRSYTSFLLLLLGLGLVVPALVVTLRVAQLTRPILDVTRVAKEVAGGDFGHKVEARTGDEIEDLADQINAMSAQLRESYSGLERKVQERTRELATLNAVSAVVSRSLDLREIMQAGVDMACEVVPLEIGAAWRLEAAGSPPMLVRIAAHGLTPALLAGTARLPLERTPLGIARQAGQPYIWTADDLTMSEELAALVKAEGIRRAVTVALEAKGQLLGGLTLATQVDRPITGEELSLLAAIGQQMGVAIENARLYESEREGHEESERRRRVAEGLREVLAVLNSEQPLQDILDFIVHQACQLLGSEASAILQPRRADGPLEFGSTCGLDPEMTAALSIPIGQGIAGRAMAERRPVVVPDILGAVGAPAPGKDWPSEAEWSVVRGFAELYHTVLALPLIARDEARGALVLYYRERRSFSEEDLDLARGVAHQAALAIESARLREQAEHVAATAERTRLARELHDSVTQSLYSVTLYGEAAARLLTNGRTQEAAEHLRELRDTAQEALREMRLLIFQLRPPALEKSGLVGALQARLEAVELRGGTQAELSVEGAEQIARVSLAVQEEIYHIAQEAMNNVLRHAKSEHIWLRLAYDGAGIDLEVRDDGGGFLPAAAGAGGGLGLPGMRERADRIDATLDINSRPGGGTRIRLRVPLQPSRASPGPGR